VEWERLYAQARSRFVAHRRQVTEARSKAESDTGEEAASDAGASTHTSGTPDRGSAGGGALASDEALAALRDKLSGGQS
jgi:small subunit ribosomal protein S1